MKRITFILMTVLAFALLPGCGDDGGGLTPIPGGQFPGALPGGFDNNFLGPHDYMWQTKVAEGPRNNGALAQLLNQRGGQCWLSGRYPGISEWVIGSPSCTNFNNFAHIAFIYNEETQRTKLYVFGCSTPECYNYVVYQRETDTSNSFYPNLYANFGPTYDQQQILMEQQTYEVEILIPVGGDEFRDAETLPLQLFYGNAIMDREVGTFYLHRTGKN